MMYADKKCICVENFKPEHSYTFTGPCRVTKKTQSVTVPAQALYAYRQGAKIQNAMPMLSDDEREFLMSGTSAEGWEKLFGKEEE